jgi:hypothetical protein
MNELSTLKARGDVQMVIDYVCGRRETIEFPNTILNKGRNALAAAVSNTITGTYSLYVNRMIFGDAGTDGSNNTKRVDASRNGLFCGTPVASKPVIAVVDPSIQSQCVFTSILTVDDANGFQLSEMALQLATGDLYSMVTFPNLTKTSDMQITWNWRLSFI